MQLALNSVMGAAETYTMRSHDMQCVLLQTMFRPSEFADIITIR